MSLIKQERVVYYSENKGRAYLTKHGAINAEAVAIIKKKYPTISDYDTGEMFHWSDLERSEVLLRRMKRLVTKSIT